MDLIVAVYDDWGIGCGGTQPVTLRADRKFFRQMTGGAAVIVGRRTLSDFPGGRPLPNRLNLVLTREALDIEGAQICRNVEEARRYAEAAGRAVVIGGASVYRQMLPYCTRAYVTKLHITPVSDTFFPNLDEDSEWEWVERLQSGQEDGIAYEMCLYRRKAVS